MTRPDSKPGPAKPEGTPTACLLEAVTATMRDEPALEAVKVDRARRAVSLATLGRPRKSDLESRLLEEIRRMEEADAEGARCALLEGAGSCDQCPLPDAQARGRGLTIEQTAETTTIARVTCPTAPRFWRWREVPWPRWVPRKVRLPDEADHDREWKLQLMAAVGCGVLGLVAWAVPDRAVSIGFFVAAYVAGSWFTAYEIWERLRERTLDVHFLMLTVALGSASIGAWAEGAALLFLFSFSGALEHYAMGRTQREIRSLFRAAPKTATLIESGGRERTVTVEEIAPGDRLIVRPGDQFPVDAEIAKGRTASDESNLTGEAVPVEKSIGDTVLAGTINLWGAVEVTVLRGVAESSLQKIIHLIQAAQHLKAPAQRFTDRFGTGYTYAVLSLSLVMFFVWWLVLGHEPWVSDERGRSAFYRSMTLLVVASPCALVLSIPSAILAAIAWAARRGILFRGGAAVEKLADVDVVAMDKTGTLTTGELRVERVESHPPGREREVAELAFALERMSTHPLARAITRYGKQQGLPSLETEQFESVTGFGLAARVKGRPVRLGKRDWLADGAATNTLAGIEGIGAGFSEVWVESDGLVGRLVLRDDIRPAARPVVEELRQSGLRTVVLTGDHRPAAEHLKSSLGLDDVRFDLKPEEKVAVIEGFTREGRRVAMIGDGVNDAPSLAAAHVGVAMGARGSDAALEQAEVVLMHDRLENFLLAFRLSQRARRVIRQNVAFSLGTVAVLVILAILGGIPLTVGVVGHEGSTVVVVVNSLRLLLAGARQAGEPIAGR